MSHIEIYLNLEIIQDLASDQGFEYIKRNILSLPSFILETKNCILYIYK